MNLEDIWLELYAGLGDWVSYFISLNKLPLESLFNHPAFLFSLNLKYVLIIQTSEGRYNFSLFMKKKDLVKLKADSRILKAACN